MAGRPQIEKWVLSPHAAIRMAQRRIAPAEIDEILRFPDGALPQGPKWVLSKRFERRNDNLIAAVVLQKEEAKL